MTVLTAFIICFLIRLASLVKSITNEKTLKKEGALEHGKINSLILTLFHVLFYIGCIYEGLLLEKELNQYSYFGIALFLFSMVILWWVILSLSKVWTVKLIISNDQVINNNILFKYFKHPNYYLNVIPEIISIALICNAWYTLAIGFLLYLIPLIIRIKQEEAVMKEAFQNY